MAILKQFFRDKRGTSMQGVALAAGVVAIASLAGAQLLEKSVQTGTLQQLAGQLRAPSADFSRVAANVPRSDNARESIRQVTVDYTPTGSIPVSLAQPIILDPCTGIRK